MLLEIKYEKRIQGEVIDFTMMECGGCGIPFYVPTQWKLKKVKEHGEFHCPNGCSRVFVAKTEEDKLKEQLAQQKQQFEARQKQLIDDNNDITNQLLDTISEKQKVEKQLKRVQKGVCPCCNRSFANLKRHMETKHSGKDTNQGRKF